jgi:hypothetical protein
MPVGTEQSTGGSGRDDYTPRPTAEHMKSEMLIR